MATRRVTFEKQQRERAKKEKAALKRERRQERKLAKEQGGDDADWLGEPPERIDPDEVFPPER